MIRRTLLLVICAWVLSANFGPIAANAAPCMTVTLTGTMGGPPEFNGLAGPGTLVRYGDDSNNCATMNLQIDAGRGTTMRLSQLGIPPAQITAVFFTHMHSDHVDGFADLMQLRWHFDSKAPKVDVVCTSDTMSALGFTISCQKFIAHLADSYVQSGEIAQRLSESKDRLQGGPAELVHLMTFEAKDEPQVVWTSGDVKVSAIRSTHIAGHASYRVDTPAGSVVVGGDGFGFAKTNEGTHFKIVQSGVTVIEDDVEIQSLSSIDRATAGETRVKRGAKIDSLVQVGHACVVGEDNIVCE